jgi:hypothetical protein
MHQLSGRLPIEGFRRFTIERSLATVEQRSKKDSKYKIVGNCMAERMGNFDEFTNLSIIGMNYTNELIVIREYCDKDDIIFHFVSLSESYSREGRQFIDRYRFWREIQQTRMWMRDALLDYTPPEEKEVQPNKVRLLRPTFNRPIFFVRDKAICNGEFTENISHPLVDVEFLRRQYEQYPNTTFVLSPFNHFEGIELDERERKTVEKYIEFRDAMLASGLPVLDLSEEVPTRFFDIPDMVHYTIAAEPIIKNALREYRKQMNTARHSRNQKQEEPLDHEAHE